MKSTLEKIIPEMIDIRRKIHAHPELAHEENLTAQLIKTTLEKYGYTVITVAGTGITCILDSGKPGKTVALRADMDALPIQEENDLSYRSKNTGKMHACGHDGHTAGLLAAACALSYHKDQFKGRIKFIFQPAEETGTGALKMIEHGILENPSVDAIFGWHNSPYSDANTFKVKSGCMHASQDVFSITIKGRGGHAAQPQKTIDPIYIGTNIAQALQSIRSRFTLASDPVVVSITQFHAGTTHNVIPDEAKLVGTIRTVNLETQEAVKKQLGNIATGISTTFGAEARIEFTYQFPPTLNHESETELALNTARRILGEEMVTYLQGPSMASEDFSQYLQKVPGCFFWIGNGNNGAIHSSQYRFNDDILITAAEMLMNVAMNYLNTH